MIDPSSAAKSALSMLLSGENRPAPRNLDEMSLAELEAEDELASQRLELARRFGFAGGAGAGMAGVFGVKKMLK